MSKMKGCYFVFHDWTKWKTLRRIEYSNTTGGFIDQSRTCLKCGKEKLRTSKVWK